MNVLKIDSITYERNNHVLLNDISLTLKLVILLRLMVEMEQENLHY